jgi:hypothetical protein
MRGDRIVAVGSIEEARAACAPGTPVERLGDVTIVPGFIDSHHHFERTGLKALRLLRPGRATPEDLVEVLAPAEFGAVWPDGEPTLVERLAGLELVQPLLHGLGITAVIDPAAVPAELSAYQHAWRRGLLTMRVVAMPYLHLGAGGRDDVVDAMGRLDGIGVRTGFGDDMLRLGGIKVYFDGQGRAGRALLREPWPGVPGDYRGEQLVSTEAFTDLMAFCARERWSVGVHCVGGGALDEVLAAFATADRVAPIRDLRFQLIHAYLEPSRANMELARQLGVVAALQPSIQLRNGAGVFERLGERGTASTPVRSWLDAGVPVAGGSDGPDFPFDPLHWMWQARTRMVDGLDAPLGPGEAISARESLAMATTHAAYASFADDRRGRLRPGMLADWVALTADPSTCDPGALRRARVVRTVVGGRTVFERAR